ncbi:hypothetical protein GCM10023084_80430 [Streptomyces lacrimifluminis]|uniref:Uncharacterized protein n=1 Tax=Streptomyces lacrimifluminis TaxID=1500077 RepID=A0A917PC83_9ACTN|nr:hypothetical protein GCM10012282_79290 [Streptomyces lacrimifluminis]
MSYRAGAVPCLRSAWPWWASLATCLRRAHAARGDQGKRLELEYAERHRAAGRRIEEHRKALEARRTCYIKVHQVIRRYRAMLYNHVHALRRGPTTAEQRAELEAARYSVRDAYAGALMGIPDEIMDHVLDVAARLDLVYRIAERFDTGAAEPGDSLDDARAELKEVSGRVRAMWHLTRTDLGIADVRPGALSHARRLRGRCRIQDGAGGAGGLRLGSGRTVPPLRRASFSSEAVIGAVTGSPKSPLTILLGRYDESGDLRLVARTTVPNTAVRRELGHRLVPSYSDTSGTGDTSAPDGEPAASWSSAR